MLLWWFHHRLVHEGRFRVQVTGRTEGPVTVRFWRPDGEEVPQRPDPPAVEEPGLEEWHGQSGIDGRTSMPLFTGGRVDYSWALVGLRA